MSKSLKLADLIKEVVRTYGPDPLLVALHSNVPMGKAAEVAKTIGMVLKDGWEKEPNK